MFTKKQMSKGGKKTAKRYGLKYMRKLASLAGIKSGEARRVKARERAEKAEKVIPN